MNELGAGDWVARAGRPAHEITTVSVSRASKPIGYWVKCGRHMFIDNAARGPLESAPGDAYRCRRCLADDRG